MHRHRQTLSPADCIRYYCEQQTGRGSYFASDYPIQRGYGFFSNLRRSAIPLMLKVGSYLGRKLLSTGRNVIEDVSQGKSFKNASKDRILESGREIERDVIRKMQGGGGIKRKRRVQSKHSKRKKTCPKDVFSFS